MSILIKDMDMPDRCFSCPMNIIEEDGEWLCNISHGSYLEYMEIPEDIAIDTRPDWCPLVEVPPHGRLIDADDMESFMSNTVQGDIRGYPYSDTTWEMAFKWIDSRPTVIPAEEV